MRVEEGLKPMLNYVLIEKETYDELLQEVEQSVKHLKESAHMTLWKEEDGEPSAVLPWGVEVYMEELFINP